ncbi:DUF1579 domain-containing protein [Sphingomonas sp.]|uniref:DUF1579 domain-containing protein n=1 Tax=Sphingomonas sp. TaxID=28214 RepID=UPI003CC6145F
MKPLATLALLALATTASSAQAPVPDVAAQRTAITALDFLDGEWTGPATAQTPNGLVHLTQTERIGSLLAGTIKLVEGRGYDQSGAMLFNAFAVISYDAPQHRYTMRSYAQGRVVDAEFERTPAGFAWGFAVGPGRVHYAATVADGHWQETGAFEMPGRPPVPTTTLDLHRRGPTSWPLAGAVMP